MRSTTSASDTPIVGTFVLARVYDSFEQMQRGVSAVLDHLEKYHSQLDTLMTENFHVFHPQDYPECCATCTV
jgi:hypothetical protein